MVSCPCSLQDTSRHCRRLVKSIKCYTNLAGAGCEVQKSQVRIVYRLVRLALGPAPLWQFTKIASSALRKWRCAYVLGRRITLLLSCIHSLVFHRLSPYAIAHWRDGKYVFSLLLPWAPPPGVASPPHDEDLRCYTRVSKVLHYMFGVHDSPWTLFDVLVAEGGVARSSPGRVEQTTRWFVSDGKRGMADQTSVLLMRIMLRG